MHSICLPGVFKLAQNVRACEHLEAWLARARKENCDMARTDKDPPHRILLVFQIILMHTFVKIILILLRFVKRFSFFLLAICSAVSRSSRFKKRRIIERVYFPAWNTWQVCAIVQKKEKNPQTQIPEIIVFLRIPISQPQFQIVFSSQRKQQIR